MNAWNSFASTNQRMVNTEIKNNNYQLYNAHTQSSRCFTIK